MPPDAKAVAREYDRLAPSYDRRWPRYVRAATEATAQRLGLLQGERLLDIGCGTGALLELLARRGDGVELAGLDPSAEMLAVARPKLPGEVRLVQGAAEQLPFADATFDVAVSNSAFHYFERPGEALREMRRVLRPGGHVVITDWCGDNLACRLCDRWLRWVDPAHSRVYGAAECAAFLAEAGLALVRLERYKISWIWGLMTATATREGHPCHPAEPR
jgi:ubiquinone/menaquinone biosynthesis C-methylase UbiE